MSRRPSPPEDLRRDLIGPRHPPQLRCVRRDPLHRRLTKRRDGAHDRDRDGHAQAHAQSSPARRSRSSVRSCWLSHLVDRPRNPNGAAGDDVRFSSTARSAWPVRPRAGARAPARSCRVRAQPGCPWFARGVARTLVPRLPSGGLRAAVYRARSARPSVPWGWARHAAWEPGELSSHHSPFAPGAPLRGARARAGRRHERAPTCLRAQGLRGISVCAHDSARSLTGNGPPRPWGARSAINPGEAKARVGFGMSPPSGSLTTQRIRWSGRAHQSGRISLGASGSRPGRADQAASRLRLLAEPQNVTPHRANQHPYRPADPQAQPGWATQPTACREVASANRGSVEFARKAR